MCDGISSVDSYKTKRNTKYNLSCLLQTYCYLSINEKVSFSQQILQTYGLTNYGSGWRM